MVYKTTILKKSYWVLLAICCCMPFSVLAELPKTVALETVTLKGVTAEEAFTFVSPDSIFMPVQINSFFNMFDRSLVPTQKSTETEALLNELKTSIEKIDPQHLQDSSMLDKLKKYESQILAVVKKEKQLDELLDYITRLKNVAVKHEPSPFSQAPKCNKRPAPEYQWPKRQCR